MTPRQLLLKKITDLNTQLSNMKAKLEIAQIEIKELKAPHLEEHREDQRTIKMLQDYIASLESEKDSYKELAATLKAELERVIKKCEEACLQRDKYKAMLNKDSSNSSKPPSTDGFKEAKAKSTREPSGKKPGGQLGHPGRTVNPFPNPTKVINKKPQKTCTCGGKIHYNDEYTSKQVVDLEIHVKITEERVFDGCCEQCGKKHIGKFSDEFINPVQYGPNLKALMTFLNGYANVPLNKVTDIINGISSGQLNISEGTIVNFQRALAEKIQEPIEAIKDRLILCNVLGADETGCKVNGKLNWIQIYTNSEFTIFGLNKKRGSLYVEGMDILELFSGILVHDHFKSYYGYSQITHAECNAHILRYLQGIVEITEHPWATGMAKLLKDANQLKKEALNLGKSAIDETELEKILVRYDKILEQGENEYNAAIENLNNKSYYNDERLLLARLKEYKKEHLRFLTDFEVPFDNNQSERGARYVKNKMKVCGTFRSEEGAENYMKIASFLSTLKKQGANLYQSLLNAFNGILPDFRGKDSVKRKAA